MLLWMQFCRSKRNVGADDELLHSGTAAFATGIFLIWPAGRRLCATCQRIELPASTTPLGGLRFAGCLRQSIKSRV
jgi:hypothetical protein